jgi:hypothetical protein
MHIEEIVNRRSPHLLILEETFDAELEVRKEIAELLRKGVLFSLWNTTGSPSKKPEIALNSIAFFLAEDFARKTSELKNTVHIRKEHFAEAIIHLRNLLFHDSVGLLGLLKEWERVATRFLSTQLGKTSNREAIFRTCEQFRIDLVDFMRVFPELPGRI